MQLSEALGNMRAEARLLEGHKKFRQCHNRTYHDTTQREFVLQKRHCLF